MVVLAHPQGVAATFRVGQHYYPGPLYEDRSLTHALTDTASTDLTVADASPLGAQPQFPTVSCAYRAEGWPPVADHTFVLDALKRACRRPSLQPSRSARCALSGCRRWVLVRKHKPYSKQRRSRLWSKPVNVRTCELHYMLAPSICGCVRVSELRICPYLAVSGYCRIASYSRR